MVRFLAIPILAAGAGLLLAPAGTGQTGIGDGGIARVVVGEGFDDMVYHVFVPAKLRKRRAYPLVFALHGDGRTSKSHLLELCSISTHENPVFVVAPGYQAEAKLNAPVIQGAGAAFEVILAQVLADYPIDPGRVVLQGFAKGSNLCTAWIDAIQNGTSELKELPFRSVWLNSTAVPPRKPVLGIPFLLFVGEKDTGGERRANIRESVRTAYRTMSRAGCDVTYLEVPEVEHVIDEECIRLMRDHLASLPDYSPALPSKYEPTLFPARQELIHGRFGSALDILEKLTESAPKERTKIQAAHRTVVEFLRRIMRTVYRRKHPTLLDFLEVQQLAATLPNHPKLAVTFERLTEKLRVDPGLRAEIDAWSTFTKAQQASESDTATAAAVLRTLAKGASKDTIFGRRARAHLQARGEPFAYPFSKAP